MTFSGLSTAANDIMVYALIKVLTRLSSDATFFDSWTSPVIGSRARYGSSVGA